MCCTWEFLFGCCAPPVVIQVWRAAGHVGGGVCYEFRLLVCAMDLVSWHLARPSTLAASLALGWTHTIWGGGGGGLGTTGGGNIYIYAHTPRSFYIINQIHIFCELCA